MEAPDSLRCCNKCGRRPTKGNPLWRGKEDRLCIACVKDGVRVTRRPPGQMPTSWADPAHAAQLDIPPGSSPDSGLKIGDAEAAEQDEADKQRQKLSLPLVVVPAFQPTMQQQLQAARLYSDLVLQEQAQQLRAQKSKSSRSAHEVLLEERARQWRQQRGGKQGLVQPQESIFTETEAEVLPARCQRDEAAADTELGVRAGRASGEEAAQLQPPANGHATASLACVCEPSAPPPPPPPPPVTPPQQPTVRRLHHAVDSPEAPGDGSAQLAGSRVGPMKPLQRQLQLKPMPFSLPTAQPAAKPGALQRQSGAGPEVAVNQAPVRQHAAPTKPREQLSALSAHAPVPTLQDQNGGQAIGHASSPPQLQAGPAAQQPQLAAQLQPASTFGASPIDLPPSFRPAQKSGQSEMSEARLGTSLEEDREVQAFTVYFLARYGLRYQAGLEELARYRRDDLLAAIRLPGGEEEQVAAVQRLLSRRRPMACCVCS